jgi:hypothetical protein
VFIKIHGAKTTILGLVENASWSFLFVKKIMGFKMRREKIMVGSGKKKKFLNGLNDG